MALTLGTSAVLSLRQHLCKFCGWTHKQCVPSTPVHSLIPRRYKFSQRVRKQEAKKLQENVYEGENSTRTSIIYAWGSVSSGALGIPSYLRPELRYQNRQYVISKINRPARVRFFDVQRLKPLDIACGYGFSVMTVSHQRQRLVMGTGINTDSQLGYHEAPKGSGRVLDVLIEPGKIRLPLQKPDKCEVLSVACGRAHTVVLVKDEGVFTLGNNAYGQCGRAIVEGEDFSKNQAINKVKDLPQDIIKVVCGQDHTLFLTESGQVYSCGLGADGQTGLAHYENTSCPELVKGDIEGERIISLGSRGDCTLAVSDKGDVFGWGNSEYSQLGSITDDSQVNSPRALPTQPCGRVVKVAAGASLCSLLNDKGQVFVWGFGILGKGPKLEMSSLPSMIPEAIFGQNELSPDTRVVDIDSGLTYMAAKNDKGDLYTWGRNKEGCLGLGEFKNQFFPLRIAMPGEVVQFGCGPDHMLALCKQFT